MFLYNAEIPTLDLGVELESVIPENVLRLLARFNEGFETGVSWTATHVPGGPWIYSGQDTEGRQQSRAEHQAWMAGWREGCRHRQGTA